MVFLTGWLVACGSSNGTAFKAKPTADASVGGSQESGCVRDTDCKGTRVCDNGRCVDPSAGGSGGRGAGGTSPNAGGLPGPGGSFAGQFGAGGGYIIGGGGAAGASGGGGESTGGSLGVGGSAGGAPIDSGPPGKPIAMFVMMDRSGSMVTGFPPPASADSWKNATTAITAFVQDPTTHGIDIGLGTFPVGSNNTASCGDGADCGTPVVPIAPLPGNADAMIQAMQAQIPPSPIALTPTECGLRGIVNVCEAFMRATTTGEPCVGVLVTDGTPTECSMDAGMLDAIVADGYAHGVRTFTLGLAGSDLNALNALAQAGGTGQAIDVSGGSQAFVAALNNIRR